MLRGCMFRVKWLVTVSCFIGESRSTSDLQLNLPGLTLSSRQMNIHTTAISSYTYVSLIQRDQASIFYCGYILLLFINCKIKNLGISGLRGLVFTWLFTCAKDFHFHVG